MISMAPDTDWILFLRSRRGGILRRLLLSTDCRDVFVVKQDCACYTLVFNAWFLGRPEIDDFRGLGGPGGQGNRSKMWGRGAPMIYVAVPGSFNYTAGPARVLCCFGPCCDRSWPQDPAKRVGLYMLLRRSRVIGSGDQF